MKDEWDSLAEELQTDKPKEREYRNPNPAIIATELQCWWSGIKDGSIKFLRGLPLLADYLPAYIPGHLIAVSGYTSAGKSQILAQLTSWAAGIQEAPTMVFSLEDSRMEKIISYVSVVTENVHRKRMLLGDVDEHMTDISVALENISAWPIRIYDDVYNIREMEGLIKKHSPRIVILDYVQNTSGEGNLYERMSTAAPQLFRIAQQYGITLFVASQIDNESAKNEAEGFIAMKGGGELAAAAHTVIHLKKGRTEEKRHKVLIQVKKNKAFGNCGEIECRFNDHWTMIVKDGDKWAIL